MPRDAGHVVGEPEEVLRVLDARIRGDTRLEQGDHALSVPLGQLAPRGEHVLAGSAETQPNEQIFGMRMIRIRLTVVGHDRARELDGGALVLGVFPAELNHHLEPFSARLSSMRRRALRFGVERNRTRQIFRTSRDVARDHEQLGRTTQPQALVDYGTRFGQWVGAAAFAGEETRSEPRTHARVVSTA